MSTKSTQPLRIAVYSHKGGTGKTTTAHSLAAGLARQGARVLAIDLDPQACLSSWLGHDSAHPSLFDVVQGTASLPSVVQASAVEGVDVIPAAGSLAGADMWLSAQTGGDTWFSRQLRTLPGGRGWNWDFYVLDCPPSVGKLAVTALAAVDCVLSPVVPTVLDSGGVARVVDLLRDLREALPPGPRFFGVVGCKVDKRRRLDRDVLAQLQELLGEALLSTMIPRDVRIAEAPSHRLPIFDHAPKSRGAVGYAALVQEVTERWQAKED